MSLIVSAKKAVSYFSGSKIFKAYFTSILGVFSGLLTQLLFIRELTKAISTDQFSIYAFIFQVVSYLAVFQLGMDFTISREVAINLASNNYSLANYSYGFIQRFNKKVILIASGCVILLAFAFLFGIGLNVEGSSIPATLLVVLFGVFQVLNFFVRPYTAALIGANYQNVVNLNNVFINIISTLFGYVLLKVGLGFYSLPAAMVFWALINIYILKRLVKTRCTWIYSEKAPINKELDKAALKFGLTGTLGGIAWTIEATADVILLNSAGLLRLVGLYVIWWRFPQMLFDLATRLTTSAYPSIAAASGQSESETKRIFSKLLITIIGFAFIISTGLTVWLPSFINLWVGQKFHYENYELLCSLIGLLVYLRIVGNCFSLCLTSVGKVGLNSVFSWIQAGIKIILSLVLINRFQLEGLIGASIVSSLIQVFGLGIYCWKSKMMSYKILILIGLLAVAPLSILLYQIPLQVSIASFVLGGLLTILVSFGIWYLLMFFSRFDRLLLNKAISRSN